MMGACASEQMNGQTSQRSITLFCDTEYKIQSVSDEQQNRMKKKHEKKRNETRLIDDWNNNDVIAWLKINYVQKINYDSDEKKLLDCKNTQIIF